MLQDVVCPERKMQASTRADRTEETLIDFSVVIPAEAGIQKFKDMDYSLRSFRPLAELAALRRVQAKLFACAQPAFALRAALWAFNALRAFVRHAPE